MTASRLNSGFITQATYRDDGCALSPSCLNCPLPRCIYDTLPSALTIEEEQRRRDLSIAEAYEAAVAAAPPYLQRRRRAGQAAAEAIAARFRVSSRTVLRVVGRVRRGEVPSVQMSLEELPAVTLEELARRSIIKPRQPWPRLLMFDPSAAAQVQVSPWTPDPESPAPWGDLVHGLRPNEVRSLACQDHEPRTVTKRGVTFIVYRCPTQNLVLRASQVSGIPVRTSHQDGRLHVQLATRRKRAAGVHTGRQERPESQEVAA